MKDFAQCDLVVEAVPENYELKADIIRALDAICGEKAILATNTSSISVTQIAAASHHPDRVVGMRCTETLYRNFDDPKFRPSPLLKQVCHAGYLGRKKGRGLFTYAAA